MGLAIMMLVVAMATVECVDRGKLSLTPAPQKGFDVDKHLGNWYMQARLPPCSWTGSDFTNIVSQFSRQPSGNLQLKGSWRSSDMCASAKFNLVPNSRPGCYTMKDPIGDVISGSNVVVATDYKKFSVIWACTKTTVDGSCGDPYVIVRTRRREPSPHTWKVIEAILDHFWKMGLSEMMRIVHDDNACVQFKEKSHHYELPIGMDPL